MYRRDFYDYDPLLQVLALKILDEEEFEGNLFESFYTKPFHEKVIQIRIVSVRNKNYEFCYSNFMTKMQIYDIQIQKLILMHHIINGGKK